MMPIPAGIVAGLFPSTQMQTTSAPFVWGQGGRRMTQDAIERERALAAGQMQADYSPVSHWLQGAARLSDNLVGALRYRNANRAEQDNLARSDAVARALTGGGTPSASAPPGSPQSSAPGGDIGLAMQVLGDPYASSGNRAIAKMLVDNAEFDRREKLKSQYGEPTETARLAREAFPNDPAKQAELIQRIAQNKADPFVSIVGNESVGTILGPQSYVQRILGGGPSQDAPDTLPADFFDKGPPPVSAAPPPPDAAALAQARAEADAWMKLNGMAR